MRYTRRAGRYSRTSAEPENKPPSRLVLLASKIEPWLPWTMAALFFVVMAFLAFRYHTVGGFGVETDFYAELYPPAKQLLAGHFSPLNYSAKGPVYSFLLAGSYLAMRDWFLAGLLLNLASAAGFLAVFYFLVRRVFNPLTAAVSLLAMMLNPLFLSYSYQVGSDMPFLLLCGLSLLFLFRDESSRDLILSAGFGLLAFLTRYNGAFIPAGAMVYFLFTGENWRERLHRAGLWLGVFIAAGLPWFISNWIVAGSPIKNDNYVNVMMDFYALGKGAHYENWTDALPKQFTGMGDIFFYNPAYFVQHWFSNIGSHFVSDMKDLVGWGVGTFVIIGILLLGVVRPVGERLLYLVFGLFYFLILALVFYNPRFSLFLLAVYIPFAVWPFTVLIHPPYMQWLFRGALLAFTAIVLYSVPATGKRVYTELQQSPVFLKEIGLTLGQLEPDKSQKLMARKPHAAYYAGLQPTMFPDKPQSVEELTAFSREQGIRYILYTAIEAQARPNLMGLLDLEAPKPGLKEMFHTQFGIVYRVD